MGLALISVSSKQNLHKDLFRARLLTGMMNQTCHLVVGAARDFEAGSALLKKNHLLAVAAEIDLAGFALSLKKIRPLAAVAFVEPR